MPLDLPIYTMTGLKPCSMVRTPNGGSEISGWDFEKGMMTGDAATWENIIGMFEDDRDGFMPGDDWREVTKEEFDAAVEELTAKARRKSHDTPKNETTDNDSGTIDEMPDAGPLPGMFERDGDEEAIEVSDRPPPKPLTDEPLDDDDLSVSDYNSILAELLNGNPLSNKTRGAAAYRERLEKEVEGMRARGTEPMFISDVDAPTEMEERVIDRDIRRMFPEMYTPEAVAERERHIRIAVARNEKKLAERIAANETDDD